MGASPGVRSRHARVLAFGFLPLVFLSGSLGFFSLFVSCRGILSGFLGFSFPYFWVVGVLIRNWIGGIGGCSLWMGGMWHVAYLCLAYNSQYYRRSRCTFILFFVYLHTGRSSRFVKPFSEFCWYRSGAPSEEAKETGTVQYLEGA